MGISHKLSRLGWCETQNPADIVHIVQGLLNEVIRLGGCSFRGNHPGVTRGRIEACDPHLLCPRKTSGGICYARLQFRLLSWCYFVHAEIPTIEFSSHKYSPFICQIT